MQPKEWADQQREILERHAQWVAEEGGMELPVLLDTYRKPDQIARIDWLKERVHGTVLDVGCSWGYVLAQVEGHAGVDINPHLLDMARLLAPQREFIWADAREVPFKDKAFDTVILAETLEHLPWMEGVALAIGEAVRIARKRVLVTVPSPSTSEAESFKHMWMAGPEEQSMLKRLLDGHTTQEERGGFICYSTEV